MSGGFLKFRLQNQTQKCEVKFCAEIRNWERVAEGSYAWHVGLERGRLRPKAEAIWVHPVLHKQISAE